MKKSIMFGILSLCVMVGFPFLAVTFVSGDGAMAVCFLLFFAVDPVYSILVGIFASGNIKARWYQPVLSAVLFLAGVWTFFDSSEIAFVLYAVCYCVIGVISMTLSFLVLRFSKKRG